MNETCLSRSDRRTWTDDSREKQRWPRLLGNTCLAGFLFGCPLYQQGGLLIKRRKPLGCPVAMGQIYKYPASFFGWLSFKGTLPPKRKKLSFPVVKSIPLKPAGEDQTQNNFGKWTSSQLPSNWWFGAESVWCFGARRFPIYPQDPGLQTSHNQTRHKTG